MADKYSKCISDIKASGAFDEFDDEHLQELVRMIAPYIETGRYNKHLKVIEKLTADQAEYLAQQKAVNKKKLTDHINNTDVNNPEKYITNMMGGSRLASEKKGSMAVHLESTSARNQHLFKDSLREQGLELNRASELMNDPANAKQIILALEKINLKESLDDVDFNIKGIALAIKDSFDLMIGNLKQVGRNINVRDDYLIRQTHSMEKIGAIPKQEWAAYIHSKLDESKTFEEIGDSKEQLKILENIYDDIVSGDYSGPNSVNLGAARTLHFKDADHFADYHNQFGDGSMYNVIAKTIRSMSRAETHYEFLGSNPRKMLQEWEDQMGKKILDERGKSAFDDFMNESIDGQKKQRDNLINEVIGYGKTPAETNLGKAIDFARNMQLASKLGAASLATVTDFAVAMAKYQSVTGVNVLKAQSDLMQNWFKSIRKDEREKFSRLLGVASQEDLNRFLGQDIENTMGGKFTNFVLKMTLLDATTKINRTTMAATFSSHMADNINKTFDQLDPRLQAELTSFDISAKDWAELAKGLDNQVGGMPLLTIPKLREAGVSRQLENKYGALLTHVSNFGAISPDARTRSLMRFGMHPESTQGKALSALFLFKSFSVRALGALEEILKSNPNANNASLFKALKNKDNLQLLGGLMATSYATATLGLWARDILFNKTPRDMTKTDNIVEAVGRSVIPIGMDYMLDAFSGEYDQYGRSFTKDLAGPVFGLADDTAKLVSTIANDLKDDKRSGAQTATKSIRLLQGNLPGSYIPVVRPILDKYFWDGLLRMANPEYDVRLKRRLEKKGQERLFY